ncbi:MAG: ammonium transporter [Coriobacteriales bacterium]|jgi:Amt family ammonium transporter|nr:ammonium transporter [Coriobacteriales bacterium]
MFDTGTSAFMIVSTMLVFLMTPALAFFYGGLSRRKHVVNTMFMSVIVIGVVAVLWVLVGDSFAYGGPDAFSEDGALVDPLALFFGGGDRLASLWSTPDVLSGGAPIADEGAVLADAEYASYPGIIDIGFQAAFAIITIAIITGALAGRIKFGAIVAIVAIWALVVYAPLAHMVWGGGLIGNENAIGAIDFAGGDVVHISSGVTGLVLCLLLGKRRGYGMMSYRPHNVPFVVLGAGLLWFGWFGFNAGSAFVADGIAGLALINTMVAPAAAMLSWAFVEKIKTGKSTLVGACTGVVAGLVVITPAAGFVEPWAAVVMGLIVSPICYFAIAFVKGKIGYDDALDAFGCHGVGGITGGILTGLLCVPELNTWTNKGGGLLYTGDPTLLIAQVEGILVTLVFVIVAVLIIGVVVKAIFKGSLRVSEREESEGLDTALHGESAYPAYNGLD